MTNETSSRREDVSGHGSDLDIREEAAGQVLVERGILGRVADYLPAKCGKIFVVTTEDVWRQKGNALVTGRPADTLFLPGGETHKRLAPLEATAEEMVAHGADRSSIVVAFGGGPSSAW